MLTNSGELTWKSTPPTEPGYYWRLHDSAYKLNNMELVEVRRLGDGSMAIPEPWCITDLTPVTRFAGCRWAGPIVAPPLPS